MTTKYPSDLPPVPVDRWNADVISAGGDADEGTAWVLVEVTAGDGGEAERRALAYLDHDYDDDLRGASAEATGAGKLPQRWQVRIALARPR